MKNWKSPFKKIGLCLTIFIFAHRTQAEVVLNIPEVFGKRAAQDLVNPEKYFPKVSSLDPSTVVLLREEKSCFGHDLQRLESYTGEAIHSEIGSKLLAWVRFACGIDKNLPRDFFEKPPFLHPLGGSWVLWAWQAPSNPFKDLRDLQKFVKWSHVMEFSQFARDPKRGGAARVLAELNADQWRALLNGEELIRTDHYLLSRRSGTAYSVRPRFIFDLLQSESFFWTVVVALGTLLLLLIIFIYKYFRIRQRLWKDKELMMQTIAHELRHPITSLQLSLEVFRENFEAISGEMQSEFLRMCGQVQRLQRIVHASRQYLISQGVGKDLFRFRPQSLPSLSEYLSDLLLDYRDRIEVILIDTDQSFVIDPYWFSVCILNLVKNALIHGKSPIRVQFSIKNHLLEVLVIDAGQIHGDLAQLARPFHRGEASGGLGLGLAITFRVIEMMGGSWTVSSNPTCFRFVIKEMNNEANSHH